ncbi:hypothetical protein C6P45_003233 [Maudiozyma exigua]|uniref:non-specific serine/threonine protein kinase n=1 Tax=Maudiozyma exigua TaxID=34358 RepID=A0A9P7B1V4_MAUEX|nr:hypothetical protein C6P45_003233 [Kazachstania exigua]
MFEKCTINNYKIIKTLGSGAYGIVFLAVDMETGNEYAIKAILKTRNTLYLNNDGNKCSDLLQKYLLRLLPSPNTSVNLACLDLDMIRDMNQEELLHLPYFKELSLQLKVHRHANIVTIHEVLDSNYISFMIMDYYGRDLFTSIVDEQHFANDGILIKKVFLQLCSALQYCHERGISHCDIKPENLLLDDDNNLYVCDFGLSSTDKNLKPGISVGSPYYMAPERLSIIDKTFIEYPTTKSDIWSLGIILINLACMRNPWLKAHHRDDKTFHHFIESPRILLKLLPISESFYQLLMEVLQISPLERKDIHNLMYDVSNLSSFTCEGPLNKVDPIIYEEISVSNDSNTDTINGAFLGANDPIEAILSSDNNESYQTIFDMNYEKTENYYGTTQSACTSEGSESFLKKCDVTFTLSSQQNPHEYINV